MAVIKHETNPEDWANNQPAYVSAAVAAGGANVSLVTLTLKNMLGQPRKFAKNMLVYLSDDAGGVGLTATTASGAVAAGASGADLGDLTSKKAKMVQTTAAGVYILSITDTAKTGFKVCVDFLNGQKPLVAATLVAGNYG